MKAKNLLLLVTLLICYLLLPGFEVQQAALAKPWGIPGSGILPEVHVRGHSLAVAGPGVTTRVSVASIGAQGNQESLRSSISADGRDVVFESYASNLVSGDTNDAADIFVHDRLTGQTTRVSVSSGGMQGNHGSFAPSISAEGRYVSFTSYASNLVSGDTNNFGDVFVHDRVTGRTTRVSVSSGGRQGNFESFGSAISTDGRYVAFESEASNLVSEDTNEARDVFVHNRVTGETTRVSVASDGTQANQQSFAGLFSISTDGRYVAFTSEASNLVGGDSNNLYDAFVHDRETGETTRVSVASDGIPGNLASYGPSISSNGRYVAFGSEADNLVSGDLNGHGDIFVHDRTTGQTTRASLASDGTEPNARSLEASISAGGRYVAFFSIASNLVSEDTNGAWDVFVRDQQTGETIRVSVSSAGFQGDADSHFPSTSADGRFVTFASAASNLVSGDTNGTWDVFVHDRSGVVYPLYMPMISNLDALSSTSTPWPQGTPTPTTSPVATNTPALTGTATATPVDVPTSTNTPVLTPSETPEPTFTPTRTATSSPTPIALEDHSETEADR